MSEAMLLIVTLLVKCEELRSFAGLPSIEDVYGIDVAIDYLQ